MLGGSGVAFRTDPLFPVKTFVLKTDKDFLGKRGGFGAPNRLPGHDPVLVVAVVTKETMDVTPHF